MILDNYCLDADNFKIIFPMNLSPIYMGTSFHGAYVSVIKSDIDKWTLTVTITLGCEIAKKVFESSLTIDRKPDELQIKQLKNAWTLCHYMFSPRFYKRRLFHKLFFSLALRDSFVRSIFQEWIKEAKHNKYIVIPNLIAPGPVAIEELHKKI